MFDVNGMSALHLFTFYPFIYEFGHMGEFAFQTIDYYLSYCEEAMNCEWSKLTSLFIIVLNWKEFSIQFDPVIQSNRKG